MSEEPVYKAGTVGVVLVNWNGAEYTVPCIESLLAGSSKPHRIVVVDNASRDGSLDKIAQRFPNVDLIRNEVNLGFTGANNIGIRRLMASGCSYIWILNNDTTVDEQCLSVLRGHLDAHPGVAGCSGKIFYAQPGNRIWYAGATYNKWTMRFKHRADGMFDDGRYGANEEVDFLSGCCMFVRRSAIEQIGMFDEHFFAYYEDSDWCLRAKKKYLRLAYVPRAVIWHKVSATVDKIKDRATGGTTSPFRVYVASRNRLYIIRKHSQDPLQTCTASFAFTVTFCYSATALLVLMRFEKFRALFMSLYDGVTGSLDASPARTLAPRYLR